MEGNRVIWNLGKEFIKELKLKVPVIQAPMAGVTTSKMVVASCKAGVMGSLGAGMMEPETIRKEIREIKQYAGERNFSVNLFVIDNFENGYNWDSDRIDWLKSYYIEKNLGEFPNPKSFAPSFKEQFDILLDEAPPYASFAFGILSGDQVKACHNRGIKVIGTATCVAEALEWENVKADYICVQGTEAGGHRAGYKDLENGGTGLFALIPEVVKHVRIPVIAAGGIMDGRGILAALILGAEGVQMGTAFLASDEASLPEPYRRSITDNKSSNDTTLTKAFSGRYARGLKNEFTEKGKDKFTLPYPIQNALTQPLRKRSMQNNNDEHMSLWAGQGISNIKRATIKQICNSLENEYIAALSFSTSENR